MKKYISAVLAVIMGVSLVSCGNSETGNNSSSETAKIEVREVFNNIPAEYKDFEKMDINKIVTIASDGSYLHISENENGAIDITSEISFTELSKVHDIIKYMNSEFGFSEELHDKMVNIKYSDGIQTEENDAVKVEWSLEKSYSLESNSNYNSTEITYYVK